MKGKIVLLFALPVVVCLGAKLYVHFQISYAVQLLSAQLENTLTLDYERVTSNVDGRIGLLGVTLRPHGLNDEVRIAEVSLKLPSLHYFLQLDGHVARQEYPQELSLRVRDLAFSTRGELAKGWEASMFLDDPDARPRAFANCVARTGLPTQLHLLDYDEIRGDFELGYRFSPQTRQLLVHAAGGHQHGVEFSGELALVMRTLDSMNIMGVVSNPEIAHASLEINDDGYYDRVFQYCESGDRLSKEAVVALLAEDLVEMFDGLPLQPDAPLVAAYSQFVSAGSRLKVTANPLQPQKLQYLSLYEPSAVPVLLNVQSQVN